jgi:hypothetical protein
MDDGSSTSGLGAGIQGGDRAFRRAQSGFYQRTQGS